MYEQKANTLDKKTKPYVKKTNSEIDLANAKYLQIICTSPRGKSQTYNLEKRKQTTWVDPKRSKYVILYFFQNGDPYKIPIRKIGERKDLDAFHIIEKNKNGEFKFNDMRVYTLNGDRLTSLKNFHKEEAFVVVPDGERFVYHQYIAVYLKYIIRDKSDCCSGVTLHKTIKSLEKSRVRSKSKSRSSSRKPSKQAATKPERVRSMQRTSSLHQQKSKPSLSTISTKTPPSRKKLKVRRQRTCLCCKRKPKKSHNRFPIYKKKRVLPDEQNVKKKKVRIRDKRNCFYRLCPCLFRTKRKPKPLPSYPGDLKKVKRHDCLSNEKVTKVGSDLSEQKNVDHKILHDTKPAKDKKPLKPIIKRSCDSDSLDSDLSFLDHKDSRKWFQKKSK